MKKFNIILMMFCFFAIASCDSFLNMEPTNSGNAETSIKTVKDAEVFINGLMRKMSSSSYYGRNFIMYGDAKGGDLAITSQGRGSDGLYTFNHSATSGSYSGFWSQMFHCILQINSLLKNIEQIQAEGTSEDFSECKGEALTARALIYYDLVRLYGKPYNMDKTAYGVPNITVPLIASDQPTRATVADNYAQILKDLVEAAAIMPKSKKDGYLNYYANLALQARVNLSMDNYGAALAAAETIIKDGKYKLYTNENWIDSWKNEYGSESIFELGIYPDEADLGTGSLGFYLMRYGKKKGAMGWFLASDYFLNRLGEDKDDVRWDVMDYDETVENTGVKRYGSCNKYSFGDKEGSITAVNIKIIRLSEIYLIAAEAALGLPSPNKQKAADYLNAIRKRSPNLAPATQATVTVDMILNEKSKEFFAEGLRFFDLIRLNKKIEYNDELIQPSVIISHREKIIDRTFFKCILPISKEEMDANPAISTQQNPGY
ncbi:MAG: RagB/SusD family nutrient uptake outer membrane protein [Bacteroidales bacterium]